MLTYTTTCTCIIALTNDCLLTFFHRDGHTEAADIGERLCSRCRGEEGEMV